MDEIEIKVEYKDSSDVDPLEITKEVTVRKKITEGSRKDIQVKTRDVEAAMSSTSEARLNDNSPQRLPTPSRNTKRRVDEASRGRHLPDEPHCSTVHADNSKSVPPTANTSQAQSTETDDAVEDYKQSYLTDQPTWYRYINEYGMMQCKFCDLKYNVLGTLQIHVRNKHPKEAISIAKAISKCKRKPRIYCRLCRATFDTLDMLKNHITKHKLTQNHKFICEYCKGDFPSKFEIISHIKYSHIDSEGNFTFKTMKRKFIGTRNPDKKFQCPYCEYLSKRNYTLTIHIRLRHTTEDDLTFNCPFCEYRAPVKYYLDSHIVAKHPESDYAKSKPKHVCDICGYSTAKRSHYLLHRQEHFPGKKYKCEFCDYQTNFPASLRDHRRIHTKEKPYSCDVEGCDFRCALKASMRGHMLQHDPNSSRMWYCDLCPHRTFYKGSFKKHMEAHDRNSQRIGRVKKNK